MDLETKIRQLIESKREGEYWDFKEEPHSNNANLLHDILCLANCLYKGDRYLIIGITDPKKGASITGLVSNQSNRKTQVNFIDFLSSKKFAGDSRPEIELRTLLIDQKEVDVLIIFDNPLKPYYLTQDYQCNQQNSKPVIVRANYIYGRINDKNIPIDMSSDVGKIERMWKQRFGLDMTPLERIEHLLMKPIEWSKNIGNEPIAYHKEFPEFTIKFSKVEEFQEVFSFFFENEKSYLGKAKFKYHSTKLFEQEYMYCDEMRIIFPVPKIQHIRLNGTENWYYYFDLSKANGKFLYFLTDELSNLISRKLIFPFLIFNDEQQRKRFNKFILENQHLLNEISPSYYGENANKRMLKAHNNSVIDPIFIDKIIQIYKREAHNMGLPEIKFNSNLF